MHTCSFDLPEQALVPGEEFPVARLEARAGVVTVGALICFDREFPEAARALGLAGAEMQTALNNPLASPFTLGVGAAATLGAALVILLRPNLGGLGADLLLPLAAFACAFLSCLLLLLVARLEVPAVA